MTPLDLSTFDSRVAALRGHRLPAYTGRYKDNGRPHKADWNRHVERHGAPPVGVEFNVCGHAVTIEWQARYSRADPLVVLNIRIDGRANFNITHTPWDPSQPDPAALYYAVYYTMARKAGSPATLVRAVIAHLAA